MNRKRSSKFLSYGFIYILFFPVIFCRPKGEDSRASDLQEYLINYYLQDDNRDQYYPAVVDTATLNNYKYDYPYHELLSFVRETKRILKSPYAVDEVKKKTLEKNFGTFYSAYLKGEISDYKFPSSVSTVPPMPALGPVPPEPLPYLPHGSTSYSTGVHSSGGYGPVRTAPAVPEAASHPYNINATVESGILRYPGSPSTQPAIHEDSCQQITRLYRPERLKSVNGIEHFILNLGDEFVQKIKVVQCRYYYRHCGDRTRWPETYEKVCEQSYNSYKTLFSIPVNKTINLLDQNLHVFEVSSGCNCVLKKLS